MTPLMTKAERLEAQRRIEERRRERNRKQKEARQEAKQAAAEAKEKDREVRRAVAEVKRLESDAAWRARPKPWDKKGVPQPSPLGQPSPVIVAPQPTYSSAQPNRSAAPGTKARNRDPMDLRGIHPLALADKLWPDVEFYDKQEEVIKAVLYSYETFVPAGNMLGKDFVTGFLVLWFFLTRHPCRIVTTSADHSQLEAVLWGGDRSIHPDQQVPAGADEGRVAGYQPSLPAQAQPRPAQAM